MNKKTIHYVEIKNHTYEYDCNKKITKGEINIQVLQKLGYELILVN